MSDFSKGDVVQLKSGGPKMTVSDTGDYSDGFGSGPQNGVSCVWFEKEKLHRDIFDAAVLNKVE